MGVLRRWVDDSFDLDKYHDEGMRVLDEDTGAVELTESGLAICSRVFAHYGIDARTIHDARALVTAIDICGKDYREAQVEALFGGKAPESLFMLGIQELWCGDMDKATELLDRHGAGLGLKRVK